MDEIILGDAYELIKKVPDKSIDLIVTDPPYLMDEHGGGGAFGNKNRPYQNAIDTLSEGIRTEMLEEFSRIMKRTNIYIFANKNLLRMLFDYYAKMNIDLLVWHKKNPVPRINNKYLSDLEYIFFARDDGVPLNMTYERASKLFDTTTNKYDKILYKHPTIKPEPIISNLICNSSKAGDVVLDPFLGSGTTCAVAKKLGRHYLGFEIDKQYYDISIARIRGDTTEDTARKKEGQLTLF